MRGSTRCASTLSDRGSALPDLYLVMVVLLALVRLVSKALDAWSALLWERERARGVAAVSRSSRASLVVDRRSDSVLVVWSGGAR